MRAATTAQGRALRGTETTTTRDNTTTITTRTPGQRVAITTVTVTTRNESVAIIREGRSGHRTAFVMSGKLVEAGRGESGC